jgi:hypothetical protein
MELIATMMMSPNKRDGVDLRASYHGSWWVRALIIALVVLAGLSAIIVTAVAFRVGIG